MRAAFLLVIPLLLVISLSASSALAQGKGHDAKARPPQQMTQQDRQRMRDDMRDAYRDRSRDRERPDRARPMTREERDKLRQDIQNANKDLRR
jgi:Ni/Co efflux regulator RcnB